MAKTRLKTKGRWHTKPFVMISKEIVNSAAFAKLSPYAVKLLLQLFVQYNGKNNGDFCASWQYMKKRGWKSNDTLPAKIKELLDTGFIIKTRQGGLGRCNLYAVTWLAIDECNEKLDVPSTNVPSNDWKKSQS